MLYIELPKKKLFAGYNLHVPMHNDNPYFKQIETIFKGIFGADTTYIPDSLRFIFKDNLGVKLYELLYIINKFALCVTDEEMVIFNNSFSDNKKRFYGFDNFLYKRNWLKIDVDNIVIHPIVIEQFPTVLDNQKAYFLKIDKPVDEVEEVVQDDTLEEDTNQISESEEYQSKIQSLEDINQSLMDTIKSLKDTNQTLENGYESKIKSIVDGYESKLKTTEGEWESKLKSIVDGYESKLKTTEGEWESKLKTTEGEWESKLKTTEDGHDSIEDLQYELEQKCKLLDNYKDMITQLEQEKARYYDEDDVKSVDMPVYNVNYDDELDNKFATMVDKLKVIYDDEFNKFTVKYNKDIGELKTALEMKHDTKRQSVLEMENEELRRENEDIFEKLSTCEKQFNVLKQKYTSLQQVKKKYKTMILNSANVNHIEKISDDSFVRPKNIISPIPNEHYRHPYNPN